MSAQQLPGYITDFKSAHWLIKESPHYLFHYTKGSLAEREMAHIEKTQEDAYVKITEFLGLSSYPKEKILYYLYPDAETKKQLMGSEWFAQSIYDDFAVHALYTEKHRVTGSHEDTHLLSLPLGLSIGFLQEGLAEYMVGQSWHGESFEEVVRGIQRNSDFIISDDLLSVHQVWCDTSDACAQQYYALAALFTGFLIRTYGREKYFELYRALVRDATQSENERRYGEILGITPEILWTQFLTSVDKDLLTGSPRILKS